MEMPSLEEEAAMSEPFYDGEWDDGPTWYPAIEDDTLEDAEEDDFIPSIWEDDEVGPVETDDPYDMRGWDDE